jgi:hypothetical protein
LSITMAAGADHNPIIRRARMPEFVARVAGGSDAPPPGSRERSGAQKTAKGRIE